MTDIKTEHMTVEGRCLCGGARYRVEGERSGIIVCHCQRCRKHMGAAYVSFPVFESGEFTWLSGRESLKVYPTVHGEDGRSFCGVCGTSMPGPSRGGKTLGGVLAGHIVDMPPADLVFHVYTASKCPWVTIPDDALQWDIVPPHFRDPDLPELDRSTEPGKITGSCLCGDVSFEATDPIIMMNCNCSRCRLSRGAAHATNLFVSADDFCWRTGEQHVVNYKLPDAERFGAAFCQRCGSLMPREAGSDGKRINIPVGCLDSDPGISPSGHIFVGSKAPWFEITDDLPQRDESWR